MKQPVYVVGTGYFVPEEVVSNDHLVATLDTSHEWIMEKVGIRERRRAAPDVNTSDLGVRSLGSALASADWKAEDLELLICSTSTPDDMTPATACYIGKKLGISPVSFDVAAACSGFLYGLSVAQAMMVAQGYDRVAVCAAEKFTKVTDYNDRASAIFFGDGSGTLLLQREKPQVGLEVVDVIQVNHNEGADFVVTPVGGYFHQRGPQVLGYALRCFVDRSREMMDKHNLAPGDLRAFVCHQANLRALEKVAAELGLTEEQHWHNVEWVGNQSSAGVATTLCQGLEEHGKDMKDGDPILLTTFGSGFTTASVLLRWIDQR